jgi:diketogulonate reductase-like aldo/keto reductase
MEYKTLSSGIEIPMVGLGTWTLRGQEAYDSVALALSMGYELIDTAEAYGNEEQVGRAVADADVPRDDLFITTKVAKEHLAYDDVHTAIDGSLKRLGTDYVDLYLVHWPNPSIPMDETFRALEEIREAGKVREVGVSNFMVDHLQKAFEVTDVPIVANQIEFHPYEDQEELLAFCKSNDVIVEGYSPLARGRAVDDPTLKDIAADHERSVAQIVLKWMVEKGIVVIPRSSEEVHLRENLELFDWRLEDEVSQRINMIKDEEA